MQCFVPANVYKTATTSPRTIRNVSTSYKATATCQHQDQVMASKLALGYATNPNRTVPKESFEYLLSFAYLLIVPLQFSDSSHYQPVIISRSKHMLGDRWSPLLILRRGLGYCNTLRPFKIKSVDTQFPLLEIMSVE
jgi:hypothetical protein